MASRSVHDWLQDSGSADVVGVAAAEPDPQRRLPLLLQVGRDFEQAIDARSTRTDKRRKDGVYYTPESLVQRLLDLSLRPMLEKIARETGDDADRRDARLLALRICDPACGSGNFLLAAALMMARFAARASVAEIVQHCICGIEIDSEAAMLAGRLLGALAGRRGGDVVTHVHHGDALLDDPPFDLDFDLVIGNPPFVDSESLCKERPGYRAQVVNRYNTARGNWDLSCVFVERAIRMARDVDARIAMVVPDRLFASDYASAVQALLKARQMECIEQPSVTDHAGFNGAAMPVSLLVVTTAPASSRTPDGIRVRRSDATERTFDPTLLDTLPPGHWSALFRLRDDDPRDRQVEQMLVADASSSRERLADIAFIGDGCTTREAYELRALIEDRPDADPATTFRLVNTGTLDPFVTRWGESNLRYLGARYRHPVVDRARLRTTMPRRFEQASSMKILVAGLARRIEVFPDQEGAYLCGKSAVQVIPHDPSPALVRALAAWLNSAFVNRMYVCVFGGRGFGKGSMNIGPRQLALLPVPSPARLVARLGDHGLDLETIDTRVDALVQELLESSSASS